MTDSPADVADMERAAYEISLPIPDGYSRVCVVLTRELVTVMLTGADVPAMILSGEAEARWVRAFDYGPNN